MTNLEILLETDRGTLGVLTGYYWPTHVVVLWARSALILPLKGTARPITTYHHIKHALFNHINSRAPATSHKNQVYEIFEV